MIPIRPQGKSSWKQVNCQWFLNEISGFYIKASTLKSWYTDLQEPMPKEVLEYKDGRDISITEAFPLWDRILTRSKISSILDSEKLIESFSFNIEKLMISRYDTLLKIYRSFSSMGADMIDTLDIMGKQMIKIYDKIIATGVNNKIVSRHHVNVCPYCGANYIFTRMNQKAASNLDHFLPKKTKPNGIFAACLFNLIPSCGPCNQIKKEQLFMVSAYDEESKGSDVAFRWRLPRNPGFEEFQQLLDSKLSDVNKQSIELLLVDDMNTSKQLNVTGNPSMLRGYGDDTCVVGITSENMTKYRGNKDALDASYFADTVVEELRFYHQNRHLSELQKSFESLNVRITQRYTEDMYLQYPLSKLYHDIYEQLEE